MLVELTIRDFAIIDELHLRFGEGLNVLTGETGAGKSIIVDAVSLLLGGRGDAGLIRAGAGRASVEGVFRLDAEARAAVEPMLEADGLEGDEPGILVLSREIRKEGRNICRINGRAVALKSLQSVGECLVDIHGQTEHLSLMRVREHADLLDRYGGLWPLRQEVADRVAELRAVRRELGSLRRDERELARRTDLLQYQVSEIDAARLEPGEDQELGTERTRLANAEQLQALAQEAFTALYESGEDQASAVDLLQAAALALAGLLRLDPSTSALAETSEQVSYQLEDLAEQVREYRDQVEFNPRRLNQVEERLSLLHNLQRKYGDSIADVLAFAERARQELETIEHSEERIAELEAEEDRLLHEIGRLGSELSRQREEAGRRLAAGIEAELDELSMARARFGVDLAWRDDPDGAYVDEAGRNGTQGQRIAFDSSGLDRVEFLVAPNVGEPLKPLIRIASGGETSRLMLALKTVLAQADRTPTLIFDEIDAGIGGRVGGVVGHKLWGLTRGDGDLVRCHQVLCVTHLPQLASYGDVHLHVTKGVVGGRTVTSVEALEGKALEEEMAGMLGAVTDLTRASAVEMLASSRADKVR
ncbi:MAG: DNA repair protein RecN [Anaerolineaceae bacterium]|nr:DNA repair protein RecN [Anaerolineaceae bacterium]